MSSSVRFHQFVSPNPKPYQAVLGYFLSDVLAGRAVLLANIKPLELKKTWVLDFTLIRFTESVSKLSSS
jgi:hypothetical protein